jgi:hypothetical protein
MPMKIKARCLEKPIAMKAIPSAMNAYGAFCIVGCVLVELRFESRL